MAMNFCLHGSARSVQEAVARAQRAEALGYEALFFADSHLNNVDPYQVMALCAVNTKKIRLGTAVTNMESGPRSVSTLDLVPTVMGLLELPKDDTRLDGPEINLP